MSMDVDRITSRAIAIILVVVLIVLLVSELTQNDAPMDKAPHTITTDTVVRERRVPSAGEVKLHLDTLKLADHIQTRKALDALRLASYLDYKHKLDYAAAVKESKRQARVVTGRCGGRLPTCKILYCESKGDIRAENPKSTASGKWQITDGTWGGYGGYSHASYAPESVQDERAAQIWKGGRGRSNWVC